MGFRIINGKPYPIGYFSDTISKSNDSDIQKGGQISSFKDILDKKLDICKTFKISNHAAERMKAMKLSEEDINKIGDGINIAKEKGCKNSVIVLKDIAFVTSIENNTIITAVEKERAKENIYTNIDSVLFL